jgi:hypothetical protein
VWVDFPATVSRQMLVDAVELPSRVTGQMVFVVMVGKPSSGGDCEKKASLGLHDKAARGGRESALES